MSVTKKQRAWQTVSVAVPTRLEEPRAGFGVRLEAFLIDYMLCLWGAIIVIGVGSLLTPYLSLTALILTGLGGMGLVFIFNHLALVALTGQTVGKMILAIRVVRADGRPVEWSRVLGRGTLGYLISAGPLGLGFIWTLWDSEQQTWHDKIFSTSVVRMK